ncbi:MAG TPA: hypothetical protein VJV05_05340 [Pyrinomonadaceae bacterium]|nr:hypothetical protein [Pyrinomonadaceae bacterium]
MPKAIALLTVILLVTTFAASSQDDIRAREIERVRVLVQAFGPKPTKVTLLTRQLIVTHGKIVRSRETSFDLKHNGGVTTIFYENVLELGTSKGSVSLVPDRAARNYGRWEDVSVIYPGTKILLIYPEGKFAKGFSNSVSQTHIIIVDKKGRERVDVPREKIVAVYGLVGGYGGVKAGASKGAEGMTNDRDVLLDGIFAGVGALVGMVKSDGRPILIYSR